MNEHFSLVLVAGPEGESTDIAPMVAVVSADGVSTQLLTAAGLSQFLADNAAKTLVCFGSGELRWRLQEVAVRFTQPVILDNLFGFLNQKRWFDVQQLDRQIRTANGLVAPSRSLEQIAGNHVIEHESSADGADTAGSPVDQTSSDARTIYRVYTPLLTTLNKLYRETLVDWVEIQQVPGFEVEPEPEWIERAERLVSVAISRRPTSSDQSADTTEAPTDSAADTSINQMSEPVTWHNLHDSDQDLSEIAGRLLQDAHANEVRRQIVQANLETDPWQADLQLVNDFRTWCQDRRGLLSETLWRDVDARTAFEWDDELVRFSVDGRVEVRDRPLRRWLQGQFDRFVDQHGFPIELPRTDTGTLPIAPEFWGWLVHCDPALAAWAELNELARTLASTASISLAAYGQRTRVGRISCELAERYSQPLFRPRSRHRLLEIELPLLPLRCFSATAVQKGYATDGWIADLAVNAAVNRQDFLSSFRSRIEQTLQRSNAAREAREPQDTITIDQAIWMLTCGWLPIHTQGLANYLREVSGVELSSVEVERIHGQVAEDVAAELRSMLGDLPRYLAGRLGVPLDVLAENLGQLPHAEQADSFAGFFRNGLERREAMPILGQANTRRHEQERPTIDSAAGWFRRRGISLFGHLGAARFELQARAEEILALCDAIRWRFAHALLSNERLTLRAVTEHALLVEVADDVDLGQVQQDIRGVYRKSIGQRGAVLGVEPRVVELREWPRPHDRDDNLDRL